MNELQKLALKFEPQCTLCFLELKVRRNFSYFENSNIRGKSSRVALDLSAHEYFTDCEEISM